MLKNSICSICKGKKAPYANHCRKCSHKYFPEIYNHTPVGDKTKSMIRDLKSRKYKLVEIADKYNVSQPYVSKVFKKFIGGKYA